MRASTWASLRTVPCRSRYSSPYRHTIDRESHNLRLRAFQTSINRYKVNAGSPDEPQQSPPAHEASSAPRSEDPVVNIHQSSANGPGNGAGSPRQRDPNNYGSASNRARRNRPPKEIPPVHIPDWFLERNVTLFEENVATNFEDGGSTSQTGILYPIKPVAEDMDHEESVDFEQDHKEDLPFHEVLAEARAATRDLQTPVEVVEEILQMLGGVMTIPPMQYADIVANLKSHIMLYCPKHGASRYLMQLVMQLSVKLGEVNFLRLDAQDIAETGGSYIEDPGTFEPNTLSTLGYDASLVAARRHAQATEQLRQEEEADEDEEEDSSDKPSTAPFSRPTSKAPGSRGSINVGLGIIPVGSLIGNFKEAFKSIGNAGPAGASTPLSKAYMINDSQDVKDNTQDLKMGLLVETLLSTPERKVRSKGLTQRTSGPNLRDRQPDSESKISNSTDGAEKVGNSRPLSKSLIVFVEDYPQINSTVQGGKFLDKLHEVVDAKRDEGQKIVIIGTASTKEMMPSLSKSGINEVQTEPISGPMRTVVVPVVESSTGQVLVQEHKNRIKAINIRHIRDMIRRLAPAPGQVGPVVDDWDLEIDSKVAFLADLDESVWPLDRVNRVATYSLGLRGQGMGVFHIEKAIVGILNTDRVKYAWARKEKAEERRTTIKPERRERDAEERIRKLRTKCNSHEKKLLSGVVDADAIRTTFADVRAPKETIEALKTLTSMSLMRPEAFTYGVLATDRIPGLLLYGPPGTGKTLLAKAVAKESGATVLEVSGSDVYDMYVGEGEKNVRAIFSLAKKLAPCIVFVDEADAILGSRSGSSNRTSHRELINQFLREWDGMTDLNAFIMVATNRPFDLDEASLRRLPRRLLVDLPVENDREAILKIHLKDETLDDGISLSKLATETPFYSGSDLKNLCVAAALACVREEIDAAAEHNGKASKDETKQEPYKFAEKRTLYERHFVKGMDEISASVSEDMGILSAIRKFDEKFGDRRGRRKKLGGYGFKTVEDEKGKGSDAARVRNQ